MFVWCHVCYIDHNPIVDLLSIHWFYLLLPSVIINIENLKKKQVNNACTTYSTFCRPISESQDIIINLQTGT